MGLETRPSRPIRATCGSSNECVTDRPTDRPTNRPTDTASYGGALSHLKTRPSRPIRCDVWIIERMRYRQTNQPTNQPTDTASYRGALSHLKSIIRGRMREKVCFSINLGCNFMHEN